MEAIQSLYNSRGIVPGRTKIWVVLVIVASLMTSYLDKLVVSFIKENVVQEVNPVEFVSKSYQHTNLVGSNALVTWSMYSRSDTNITDAVYSMINDTRNIPGAITGKVYKPRMSSYEVMCDDFDVEVHDMAANETRFSLPGGGSCAKVTLCTQSILREPWGNVTITGSNGRWRLTTPIVALNASSTYRVDASMLWVNKYGVDCGVIVHEVYTSRTIVGKCILDDGTTIVTSMSAAYFWTTIGHPSGMFWPSEDANELMQAMKPTINTTFTSPTLAIELRIVGGVISMFTCFNEASQLNRLNCTYITHNIIVTKPQPNIQFDISNPLFNKNAGGTLFTVDHIPEHLKDFAISRMGNVSSEITHFFAALGQNFRMDWGDNRLYILYDVYDTKNGVDAPEWLVTAVVVTMALCFLVWMLTTLQLDGKYSNTLYGTLSARIGDAPMLMRFNPDSMELEGIPVMYRGYKKDGQSDDESSQSNDEKDTQSNVSHESI